MCELLQRADRVFNQHEPIAYRFEFGIALHAISARHRRDRAALKCVADEAMRVNKLAVEAGAGVVLLRECKEEFARADRARVNRKAGYSFVKHRGASTRRISAHQSCC